MDRKTDATEAADEVDPRNRLNEMSGAAWLT